MPWRRPPRTWAFHRRPDHGEGQPRVPADRDARPALLANAKRTDHIEVVDVHSGEVVLFWDRPAHAASQLARALRKELAQLQAEDFIARWSTVEH